MLILTLLLKLWVHNYLYGFKFVYHTNYDSRNNEIINNIKLHKCTIILMLNQLL